MSRDVGDHAQFIGLLGPLQLESGSWTDIAPQPCPPHRMTTLSAGVRAALSAARFGCMMAGSQVYVPGLTTRA
jgi:hypothetical protein